MRKLLMLMVVAGTLAATVEVAEAGPLRRAGRGVKAVAGKVVKGLGRLPLLRRIGR